LEEQQQEEEQEVRYLNRWQNIIISIRGRHKKVMITSISRANNGCRCMCESYRRL
jgi:hypothetical protein